jgi:hypothetical protein
MAIYQMVLCPFCGKTQDLAPSSCICQSEEAMRMSRRAWQTRPIEDALHARITALEASLAELHPEYTPYLVQAETLANEIRSLRRQLTEAQAASEHEKKVSVIVMRERDKLLSALTSMVEQYLRTGPGLDCKTYSHDFMSAGEETLELLLDMGLMVVDGMENYTFVSTAHRARVEENERKS